METNCPSTPSELGRAAGHPSWGLIAMELILQGYQLLETKNEFLFLFPQTGRTSEWKTGSKVRTFIFDYSANTMQSQVNPTIAAYSLPPLPPPLKPNL